MHAHILYNLSDGFPSILYTGNELTLTIPKAQKSHTGHYVCHLSYSILGVNGSRKAASNVYVYSPGKTTLQPIDNLYMLVYFKEELILHFLNTSFEDDLRCKETVDENGLRWETGVAGVVYYALCPEGHVGKHHTYLTVYTSCTWD